MAESDALSSEHDTEADACGQRYNRITEGFDTAELRETKGELQELA